MSFSFLFFPAAGSILGLGASADVVPSSQEWLKDVRNGAIAPSPFLASLLLMMARNQRLEDGSLAALKVF